VSDRTHRIIATAGGIAFVVIAALLQAHLGAKADKAFEIAMTVLGALGFGVTKPLLGPAPAPSLKLVDKEPS
jgi:hypothetical protein